MNQLLLDCLLALPSKDCGYRPATSKESPLDIPFLVSTY